MQEEIENRSVTLAISATKLSVLQTPVKFKEMLKDTVIAKTRKKELER